MRIEEKPWDSKIFGVHCGKVYCDPYDKSIETDGWDFLHARVPVGQVDCIATLKTAGFREVAIYLTLSRDLHICPPLTQTIQFPYREATEDDAEHVGGLAAQIFSYDRFHADEYIPREVADAYKRTWGGNLCRGRAEVVFIATDTRYGVIGFSSLRGGFLGLNGVHPKHRRRGIGTGLMELVCKRLLSLGERYILVSTQESNAPALGMYWNSGFFVRDISVDLHWIRNGLEW